MGERPGEFDMRCEQPCDLTRHRSSDALGTKRATVPSAGAARCATPSAERRTGDRRREPAQLDSHSVARASVGLPLSSCARTRARVICPHRREASASVRLEAGTCAHTRRPTAALVFLLPRMRPVPACRAASHAGPRMLERARKRPRLRVVHVQPHPTQRLHARGHARVSCGRRQCRSGRLQPRTRTRDRMSRRLRSHQG